MISVFGLTIIAVIVLNLYLEHRYLQGSELTSPLGSGELIAETMLASGFQLLEGSHIKVFKRPVWRGYFASNYRPRRNRLYLRDADKNSLAATITALRGIIRAERNKSGARGYIWQARLLSPVNITSNLSIWLLIIASMAAIYPLQVIGASGFLFAFAFHLFSLPLEFELNRLVEKQLDMLDLSEKALATSKRLLDTSVLSQLGAAAVTVMFPFQIILYIAEDWREAERSRNEIVTK